MQKILTISIPTWNRASLLQNLLSELTQQIIEFNLADDIEVLVSNNNSSDKTDEVAKSFQQKFNFITYNKNETNIGGKSNVLKSMELASSEFVIFIGDDDRIRKDCLTDIISLLKSNINLGVVIDSAHFKRNYFPDGSISLENLLEKYYWNIGNAGVFITRTSFIKTYLQKFGYNFFNECWPQTQLMILGLSENKTLKCFTHHFNIHTQSNHGDVMVYTSYYLWRTCYYDLFLSVDSMKETIGTANLEFAKKYLTDNIMQFVFNVLQCGVFVDNREIRNKTFDHIKSHLNIFSSKEKIFFNLICFVLKMPNFLSRFLSNTFILGLRGTKGLKKKNDFVKNEIAKKNLLKINQSKELRQLEFERN